MVGETHLEPYPSGILRCESRLALRIMLDAKQELRKLPLAPHRFDEELSLVFVKDWSLSLSSGLGSSSSI